MPVLIFRDLRGDERRAEASVGETLLEVALQHRVPGILGECGGCASCGTCSVVIEEDAHALFPPRSAIEQDLLLALGLAHANARLCCQLRVPQSAAPIVLQLATESG